MSDMYINFVHMSINYSFICDTCLYLKPIRMATKHPSMIISLFAIISMKKNNNKLKGLSTLQ